MPRPLRSCPPPYEITHVGSDDSGFFRTVHGRTFNTINTRYMLPADQDEVRRAELHHRMMQFVLEGKNYVGPIKDVLRPHGDQRQILDVGTGAGFWAIDMADEFPRVEVTGVDLAPIQPRTVPPNCTFELCDFDQTNLPYPNHHFDVIHARSMHTGINNYQRFLGELARLLRPGGMLILVEPDLEPWADGKSATEITSSGHASGLPGWFSLWAAYSRCLRKRGIDVSVPEHLLEMLEQTDEFEKIVAQEAKLPIGFWPQDPTLLTIGELAWMQYDLLLPAMRPIFLASGLSEDKVNNLIANAQRDLYYPVVHPSTRLHVVHAIKRKS